MSSSVTNHESYVVCSIRQRELIRPVISVISIQVRVSSKRGHKSYHRKWHNKWYRRKRSHERRETRTQYHMKHHGWNYEYLIWHEDVDVTAGCVFCRQDVTPSKMWHRRVGWSRMSCKQDEKWRCVASWVSCTIWYLHIQLSLSNLTDLRLVGGLTMTSADPDSSTNQLQLTWFSWNTEK